MTGLHRTALTTSQKVECAALALAGQDCHGTVSAVSRQFAISRPTVYQARDTAAQVLTEHFCTEQHAVRVEVDEAQLHRAVVALRVMAPNAIRAIEELLPICTPEYGCHTGPSSRCWSAPRARRVSSTRARTCRG